MDLVASLLELLRTCLSTKLLCPLHLTFWQSNVLGTLRLPADTKGGHDFINLWFLYIVYSHTLARLK